MPAIDWSDVQRILAEDQAKLISDVSSRINKTRTIVRQWEKFDPKFIGKCIEYLDLYTSVNNIVAGTPVRSFSVQNPTAADIRGTDTFYGFWRCVTNEHFTDSAIPGGQAIRQTLRYGYAPDLNFSEGRIMSIPGYPGDGAANAEELYYTIQIPNMDVQSLESAQAQVLAAGTYNNLTVGSGPRALTLSGLFYVIHCSPAIVDDGSGVINILLAQPQCTLTGYTHYLRSRGEVVTKRWGVPKTLAQGIIDAWRQNAPNGGLGTSADMAYHQGLVDLILKLPNAEEVTTEYITEFCLGFTEWESIWWDDPDENDHLASDHPNYGLPGWTFRRTLSKTLTSPHWDIHVYAKLTTPVILPATIIADDYASQIIETKAKGILPSNLPAYPVSVTPGEVQTRTVDIKEDGTLDVARHRDVPRERQWTRSFPTLYGYATHKHVEDATTAQMNADPVLTSLDGSTHNRVSGRLTPAGLNSYDIDRIPSSESWTSSWVNFQKTVVWTVWHYAYVKKFGYAYRLDTIQLTILQTQSVNQAYDLITYLSEADPKSDHTGSNVDIIGGGKFFRSKFYTIAHGVWTSAEP